MSLFASSVATPVLSFVLDRIKIHNFFGLFGRVWVLNIIKVVIVGGPTDLFGDFIQIFVSLGVLSFLSCLCYSTGA